MRHRIGLVKTKPANIASNGERRPMHRENLFPHNLPQECIQREHAAKRAVSCLVDPEIDDRVLVVVFGEEDNRFTP